MEDTMQETGTPAATTGLPAQAGDLTPPSVLDAATVSEPEPLIEGQGGPEEGPEAITSWEGLEQAEWFPAALEGRDQKRDEERDGVLRKEMRAEALKSFDPHMQRQEATLNNLFQEGQKAIRTMRQMVEDQQWDRRGAENWAADHQDFMNALNGAYWGAGVQRTLNQLAEAAGDRHLIPDMHARLTSFLQGQSDPAFMTDFVDRLSEGKMKDGLKAAEERAKTAERELRDFKAAHAAQQQVQQAAGTGANLAPGSPAGSGKNPEEAWVEAGCPERGPLKEAYETWLGGQAT